MGFERFGKHGYVSQAKVAPIVDYLKKGELTGTKCQKCNSKYFPPRADCPKCRLERLDWIRLNNECRLITFTEIYFAPPDFQKDTPYLLGLAELEEGAGRVFAPISRNVQRSELKPGLPLILRPATQGDSVFYELERAE